MSLAYLTEPSTAESLLGFLTAKQANFFRHNGYLHLEGVIPREHCASAVDFIWNCMPQRLDRHDPNTWGGRVPCSCGINLEFLHRRGHFKIQKGALAGDIGTNPALTCLLQQNEQVIPYIDALLGSDNYTSRIRGLYSTYPTPKWITAQQLFGNRYEGRPLGKLLSWIKLPKLCAFPSDPHIESHVVDLVGVGYLSDANHHGGALHVWPGSHQDVYPMFESKLEHRATPHYNRMFERIRRKRPVEIVGKAGDLILFHGRLLHAPSINKSSPPRHAIFVDYKRHDHQQRIHQVPCLDPFEDWSIEPAVPHAEIRFSALELRDSFWRKAWLKSPRLRRAVRDLVMDKSADLRASISQTVRLVQAGEKWLFASNAPDHFDSHKLMIQGDLKWEDGVTMRIAHHRSRETGLFLPRKLKRHKTIYLQNDTPKPIYARVILIGERGTANKVIERVEIPPGSEIPFGT